MNPEPMNEQTASSPLPSPPLGEEREILFWASIPGRRSLLRQTSSVTRTMEVREALRRELAPGYFQVIPPGFQFGSLHSHGGERCGSPTATST